MRRQGQLNQNAVDGLVRIQLVNECKQLVLSGVRGQIMSVRLDAHYGAASALVTHIDFGSGFVANQHDSETGSR